MKTMSVLLLVICIVGWFPSETSAQVSRETLRKTILQLIQPFNGTVGVAAMGLEDRDTLTVNGQNHLPMQSVFKFPLALAIMNQVDKGILSMNQTIKLTSSNLLPKTWSPLRDKYPQGNAVVTLREVLTYTVMQSDNNGCDILFRLMGGPKNVEAYIHNIGISKIAIVGNEEDMHLDWELQYKNWCEPFAMVQLLDNFFHHKDLTDSSTMFLMNCMRNSPLGKARIKGLLPENTEVMHKTGSSGVRNGIAGATNDAGIVTLPDGKHFALVIFVTNATADEPSRDKIIARISKNVWDYFISKK